MAVKIQIKDMAALKKKLRAMEKAPQKVVNGVMGDIRKRAPSWVATEVAQTYGVKKAEITGQKIGTVGGFDASKPVLHFEVRIGGKPVDPSPYLR